MTEFTWTGTKEELANERNQIPPQELAVGHCYEVLPLSAYSPSDFMVRLSAKQGEFLSLIDELRQIYLERPSWLRVRASDASRYIPIAYVSDDDYVGRGYIAVELVDDVCVVYDVDDGTFDYVNLSNIFRLGIDHAATPAFCTKMGIAGVKPKTGAMWSQGVCLALKEKIMNSPLFLQVELIRGETVLAQVRSTDDGFFCDAWLAFKGLASLNRVRGETYPYLEEEFDVL